MIIDIYYSKKITVKEFKSFEHQTEIYNILVKFKKEISGKFRIYNVPVDDFAEIKESFVVRQS